MESVDLDREELSSILSLYHLDGLEEFGDLPGASPSRVYWVRANGRRYLLRISSKRRFKDMVFERDLLDQLRRSGLPVPRLIENVASGAFTPWTSRGRYVSLFEDLGGRRLGVFELRTRHTRAIGEFLARMHTALDGFSSHRGNEFDLLRLEQLREKAVRTAGTPKLAARYAADVRVLCDELDRQRERRPRGTRGVVHADLFVGNARFREDRLSGVIDFDRACTDRLNWDLAVAINAWCWEPSARQAGGPAGAFSRPKLRGLLDAYSAIRPLSGADVDELSSDLRLVALRFALSRFSDFELKRSAPAGRPYKDYRHFLARLSALRASGGQLIELCAPVA